MFLYRKLSDLQDENVQTALTVSEKQKVSELKDINFMYFLDRACML